MHRTGLGPHGQEDDAVRWVAVRHGSDHIHVVAMLARQDGGKPRLSNERYRVREVCLAAEERYELRRTAPGDRTAARRPTRAEHEKTRQRGWPEPPRVTLKRAVSTAAAGASSEYGFFARLDGAGVLVRKRMSTRNPTEVTGYAVALPSDTAQSGGPVWFGGGKLAADLTWPKLRRRWELSHNGPPGPFTPAERDAIWQHAAKAATSAATQIRPLAATNPAAAADASWAAADTLHAAAAALGSRVLRQAADSYDRAARAPYGRIPPPTPAGNSLRHAARLLATTAAVTADTLALVTLVTRLAALAEAVAGLRSAQRHAAQASAARRTAGQLLAARGGFQMSHGVRPSTTAAQVAGLDTPIPLRLKGSFVPRRERPARRDIRSPHKPRGPTR